MVDTSPNHVEAAAPAPTVAPGPPPQPEPDAATGKVPGHDAHAPWHIPAKGWWQVLKRVWEESGRDNISLVSAGVAFYAFLSFVPLIGSVVLIYGIVADPATIAKTIATLFSVMPKDAVSIISQQLQSMVATAGTTKGWALLLAIATSIYGATRASGGLVMALNVAYEEKETRSFIRLNLVILAFTVGFVVAGILLILLSSAMVAAQALLDDYPPLIIWTGRIVAWLFTALLLSVLVAITYRYAPDRRMAKWKWISPGSLITTLGGLAATAGFSAYVVNFGNYNATYGALGAVVVFLLWLYLLAYLMCIGAEVNAELEKQTHVDTTVGGHRQPGDRGAAVADHVVPNAA